MLLYTLFYLELEHTNISDYILQDCDICVAKVIYNIHKLITIRVLTVVNHANIYVGTSISTNINIFIG